MEISLGTLVNSQMAAGVLYQHRGFSGVTTYRIMKNIKAIEAEVKNYEEQRIKLCEKYANKDEEGKPVIKDGVYDISEEAMEKYNEEIEALLDEMVELSIKKVTLEEVGPAKLSPAQMETVEFMLDIGEE